MSFTKFGRKILGFAALLLIVVTLVACGGKKPTTPSAKEQAEKDAQAVLGKIIFAEEDKEAITQSIKLITSHKDYPSVTVAWSSNKEDVISSTGAVNRPTEDDERVITDATGRKVVEVVLTAKVSAIYKDADGNEATTEELTKDFAFTVLTVSADIVRGTIAEVKAAAWNYIYGEKGVDKKLSSDSSTVFNVEFVGKVTAKLLASGATKGFMVHDGTEGIYVYDTNTSYNVGDYVKVIGEIYSYYGSLQVGSNITSEKVADPGNITLPAHTAVTPTSWEAEVTDGYVNGVFKDSVVGYFGGKLYVVEGTLINKPASGGSSDEFCIQDPATSEEAWIYYKSYTDEMKATLTANVGKYVKLYGVTYDRDSRMNKNEILWTGEIEEATAPVLTDEQKLNTALANIVLGEEYLEDFTLSTAGTWEIVSGTGIEIVDGVAKVTQADDEQTVVLKVTVTIGEATGSKEFTIVIPAAKLTPITIAEAITLCGTEKNVYTDKAYVVMGVVTNIAHETYGNLTIKDATGELYIYGVYDKTGDVRYDKLTYKPQVGDVLVLKGVLGYYSSPQMKNGTIQGLEYASTYERTSFTAASALVPEADNTTTESYYLGGYITEIASEKYGNAYIKDALGNQFYLYGMYSIDEKRYDAMTENKPVVGDYVVVYGTLKNYKGTAQVVNATVVQLNKLDLAATLDPFYGVEVPETVTEDFELDAKATWVVKSGTGIEIVEGVAKVTRGDEDQTVVLTGTIGEATKDYTVVVSKKAQEVAPGAAIATFALGNDVTESPAHKDGSEVTTYTETNNTYKLELTACSKVYSGACDETGKSCLKLGTGKAVSTFTFTVPEEITKVIIYVAGYKAYESKFTINGGEVQTCTTKSDEGLYQAITIETTTTKTITFATIAGAPRVMINTIEWYKAE